MEAVLTVSYRTLLAALNVIIEAVKTVIVAALTLVGLFGQMESEAEVRNALTSSLMSLRNPDREAKQDELVARILAVPESMHQPKRVALTEFARELAGRLAGRDLKPAVATRIAADITGALRSAGMGTRKFTEHISSFEKSLSDMGMNVFVTRSLTSKLRTAGEQVRGPQDLPVLQFR